MTIEDAIIILIDSSEIYLTENQIMWVVNSYLNNFQFVKSEKILENHIIEMSLRSILSMFYELFYIRYTYLEKFLYFFHSNLNYFGKYI